MYYQLKTSRILHENFILPLTVVIQSSPKSSEVCEVNPVICWHNLYMNQFRLKINITLDGQAKYYPKNGIILDFLVRTYMFNFSVLCLIWLENITGGTLFCNESCNFILSFNHLSALSHSVITWTQNQLVDNCRTISNSKIYQK